MINFKERLLRQKLKLRRFFNRVFGKIRQRKLSSTDFTIISNNCWGGIVYEYYNIPKNSPTVGMYFFADEYIKFISRLKYYLGLKLEIITYEQSKYKDILIRKNQTNCLIGKLDDVEIVLLHYHNASEAVQKWERRCKRVNWDNIIFKMSEMNCCTLEHLKAFDNLPTERKILFVSKDYGLKSQIVWSEWTKVGEIKNDTTYFKKHLNLSNVLNRKA